ncbi:hypothetical protein NOK12_39440 [Nocardioides sp. OK12]|nr:hypothetical protein NOK12_39440 [Nocardioides sp. OK12]
MEDNGLSLAAQKTEIMLLTKKRSNTLRSLILGVGAVQTMSAGKYLGVMLDNKLKFGEHIIRAADKPVKLVASLGTHMAKVDGPRLCIRRLLIRADEAVMPYGAEVWAEALQHEKFRKCIAAVLRRGALRIACSCQTVSEPAEQVVAGVIPFDLLTLER